MPRGRSFSSGVNTLSVPMRSRKYKALQICCILTCLVISTSGEEALTCSVDTQKQDCGNLICDEHQKCHNCQLDDQCRDPLLGCTDEGYCHMLRVWHTFTWRSYLVFAIAFAVTSIAVVAGIGGGGILLPLYLLGLNYSGTLGVAATQSTIVGQSLLNSLILMRRKHPDDARLPLINYDILLVLFPTTLAGAAIGQLIGKVIPMGIRLIFLIVLVVYLLKKVIVRLRAQLSELKKKNEVIAFSSIEVDLNVECNTSKHNSFSTQNSVQESPRSSTNETNSQNHENASLHTDGDAKSIIHDIKIEPSNYQKVHNWIYNTFFTYPGSSLLIVLLLWLFLAAMTLIRSRNIGLVECASVPFWIIYGIIVLVNLSVEIWTTIRYFNRNTAKIEQIPNFKRNIYIASTLATFAGIGATVLGLGGGIVINVILLELNEHSTSVSATGSFITFITSSISAVLFLLSGDLEYDYAILYFVIGTLATLLGQFGFQGWIQRNKKAHYVAGALALLLFLSLAALVAQGVVQAIQSANYLDMWLPTKLCR